MTPPTLHAHLPPAANDRPHSHARCPGMAVSTALSVYPPCPANDGHDWIAPAAAALFIDQHEHQPHPACAPWWPRIIQRQFPIAPDMLRLLLSETRRFS
ncbi:hypothetical protein [Marinivivus vitaminiproducens]|uniref:hypothetical protein n=1 Tax=Marinivivus vitaminiproducens TaxID=3035935 RepID=UPI00279B1B94|nr:hypothetical protein P4R82_24610 [Geminicoccaceae bacterium SCSIO 64248]